jgi:acetylornithine deacetylase
MDKKKITEAVERNLDAAVDLLAGLIRIPSTRGEGKDATRFLEQQIRPFADSTELVVMPESILSDPDYSFKLENFKYDGAANLRVRLNGVDGGKSVAFNTHQDVVPPSVGQENAYAPYIQDEKIFGRGAIDAKGQIATLWLMVKAMHDLGVKPRGDITIDFVLEEECGGNGSLLVVRNGLKADAAVICEPTELQVVHLVRGAVWFTVETTGKEGHSGSPGTTASALKEAIRAMEAIEGVREKLLAVSRKETAKVRDHPNPTPLTFGMLHSGNWPAAAPNQAVLKGVFGFLPPFKREQVQAELTKAVSPLRADIRYDMLNNNSSDVEENHPLVKTMLESAHAAGIDSKPEFMNAACDAWRYTEQLKIPAVVFGGGSITTAHARNEHMPFADLKKAATALVLFIDQWSGLK